MQQAWEKREAYTRFRMDLTEIGRDGVNWIHVA